VPTKDELPDFDALWDYNDPAATERAFRDLLPFAERAGDQAYHIQLLTQIARAEGLQHNFDAAHRTLDDAERRLADSDGRPRIRYLLERGRVLNSSKHPDQAQPLFLAAWELGRAQQEDFYAVDAAHMLAIIAPPDQQLAWNRAALALAEQSPDPRARKWLGSLYNNIGWTEHDVGQYQPALETFQKALQCRLSQGSAPEIRIARWCIARTLRSLSRYEDALAIQRALLDELAGSQATDGFVHEELAECMLALGQAESARSHFALAYAALVQDRWLAENEPARIERLKTLGATA
jgi:tetratricopeptide (TPR) repeat protein